MDNDQLEEQDTSRDLNYRLLGRQSTVHKIFGGGAAKLDGFLASVSEPGYFFFIWRECTTKIGADIVLWKRGRVSFGVIVVATVVWLLFERSELSSLSICSDVLLVLIVFHFLRVHYAAFRNKELEELPEPEMSEEMVISVAASFRGKVNYALLMAHDITLGKDFRLFSKVVVCLWLMSVIGSYFSFFSIAYIGVILFLTVPALYDKHQDLVDRFAGNVHQKFSSQYRIVDENVISRIPHSI